MTQIDRRGFLLAAGTALALPPAIARAAAINARVRTGTIADVEHVVILMQENRSFDHYFGEMNGVRGFGDRFPVPVPDAPGRTGKTNWIQVNTQTRGGPPLISPFPLKTSETFALMRVEGTPHGWSDAQAAWDEGRMANWPTVKNEHSMGHFRKEDIPFQYAMADAFTLCDAYHCAIHTGTNSNRLFLWTGTNDPTGRFGGPSISNSHDQLASKGGARDSYTWTTFVERLQAAGISWRVYQDMADNFTDNPLVGFKSFRDSHDKAPGSDPRLAALGVSTWHLDGLRADVLSGALPKVSYVVAPSKDSEHPGPSSPAQGADYTARVLNALTADPAVWAKTVLFVMFDENDGFFDHDPPPAPPSPDPAGAGAYLGASTVDTTGEYHLNHAASEASTERPNLVGRPYGLGPRVPMYVISPWSRGGYVNSQVFDHTSVIRFLEARFGVQEPNISPWRREVCGDLTSCFNFKTPNDAPFMAALPVTTEIAARAAALPGRTRPTTPLAPAAPVQAPGVRRSRALPYNLNVAEAVQSGAVRLTFQNEGAAGAVFHVYDRLHLDRVPRRYTVGQGMTLAGAWAAGAYDLWVRGPNGFHRHFVGVAPGDEPIASLVYDRGGKAITLEVRNPGRTPIEVSIAPGAYGAALSAWRANVRAGARASHRWVLDGAMGWYDLEARIDGASWRRRFAGRVETGKDGVSDPAMGGLAIIDQPPR